MSRINKIITSTNLGLSLPSGATLVLINSCGDVIQQGSELTEQIFHAVTEEVVAQVFSDTTPLSAQSF
ncbi:MAG: hypothetical protein Alis3KO_07840 [Aliiglaciecola sp.]